MALTEIGASRRGRQEELVYLDDTERDYPRGPEKSSSRSAPNATEVCGCGSRSSA